MKLYFIAILTGFFLVQCHIDDDDLPPQQGEANLYKLTMSFTRNGETRLDEFTFQRNRNDTIVLHAQWISNMQPDTITYIIVKNGIDEYSLKVLFDTIFVGSWIPSIKDGLIENIHLQYGGYTIENYKIVHDASFAIDSIIEPERNYFGVANVQNISHSYIYSASNCIRFVNSLFWNGEMDLDTISLSYTNLQYSKFAPDQIPSELIFSSLRFPSHPFDILYLFSLVDLHAMAPNENLVESRKDTYYTYEFNSFGNPTNIKGIDSESDYVFEYILEYY